MPWLSEDGSVFVGVWLGFMTAYIVETDLLMKQLRLKAKMTKDRWKNDPHF
jgi:hypothetical protein